MKPRTRITVLSIVLLIIFALPATALASKRIYTAKLRGEGDGRGSAVVATNVNGSGMSFAINVRNLTGDPTAIHLHSAEDSSVLVTLCSGGTCPANNSSFSGDITPGMFAPGVTGGEFANLLDAGLVYINVHTAAFPGGEISGTLVQQ